MDTELREARLAAGLTVRELARRAGTSHATVVAYEQGRKIPRHDTRERLLREAGWVSRGAGGRRTRVDERGRPRGDELVDVIVLADSFPNARRPATLTCPCFPDRLGPEGRRTR